MCVCGFVCCCYFFRDGGSVVFIIWEMLLGHNWVKQSHISYVQL